MTTTTQTIPAERIRPGVSIPSPTTCPTWCGIDHSTSPLKSVHIARVIYSPDATLAATIGFTEGEAATLSWGLADDPDGELVLTLEEGTRLARALAKGKGVGPGWSVTTAYGLTAVEVDGSLTRIPAEHARAHAADLAALIRSGGPAL